MTTTVDSTPRSLHKKLAQIMYEADRIPKNGTAPKEMGGYKFVQVGDAADYIRKALAEQVITMVPTAVQVVGQQDRLTKAGGTMTTVDLITTWTLTDGETGESIEIQSFGAGADTGDKYSGKASTSAMKYALLTGFLLSTGEDSELGGPEAGQAQTERQPARSTGDGQEWERLLGEINRTGAVARGTGTGYKLEAREEPAGTHAIGFRLELGDNKHIPQVLAKGELGEALYLALAQKPERLYGQKVTLTGDLYEVGQAGRKAYHRLVLEHTDGTHRIETDEFTLPAQREPESVPAFTEEELAGIEA